MSGLHSSRLAGDLISGGGGSDTEAIGGDLAYHYGSYDSLTGISALSAQGVLGSAQFGAGRQALQSFESLSVGVVKLA